MASARLYGAALVICAGIAAAPATGAEAGDAAPIPAFQLPASDGGLMVYPPEEADPQITVVCFLGTECPLAHLYGPRLARLAAEFEPRGVRFLGINSNHQDSMEDVRQYVAAHELPFPIARDYDNVVADRFKASRTPEVIVLDADRHVRYRGRIDDQYLPGIARPEAGRHDLREALEELLAGREVTVPATEAAGCLIGRVRPRTADAQLTYCRDVAPLLQQHCVECHREGEIAPFSLADYDSVIGWADAMLESIDAGRMPPWHASPQHGDIANARVFPEADKQVLLAWVEAGAPYGDASDLPAPLPAPSDWRLARAPDLVVPMRDRPFIVPAEGAVEYQYFVVDPQLREDRWITGAQVIPGSRSVVHHAIVFVRPPDGAAFRGVGWLTGYVPGQRAAMLPEGCGRFIPAGSRLVFQMHYTPNGRPQEDLTKIGLLFGDESEITHEVFTLVGLDQEFEIPPHAADFPVIAGPGRLPHAGRLLAVAPHMHLRGKAFQLRSRTRGKERILLDVPRYDFNWQHVYEFADPLPLDSVDKLEFTARFDNSRANSANPDPGQHVTWGDQTWEEMAVAFFEVAVPRRPSSAEQPSESAAAEPATEPRPVRTNEVDAFVRTFFERFDHDGDGFVDREEVPLSIRRFGFGGLDGDDDGRLTHDEVREAAGRRDRFRSMPASSRGSGASPGSRQQGS